MSLMSRRSKSVSNIIETPAFNKKDVKNLIEHQYKTYSSDNLYGNKDLEVNASPTAHKSQNIIAKLVASLEKKNEKSGDSNADDEFLTRCYTRIQLPRVTSYHPNHGASKCVSSPKESKDIEDFQFKRHVGRFERDDNAFDLLAESVGSANEKKVKRKRSIRGMLSCIIGWKKHTSKEKPRRSRSCDELETREEKLSSMAVPIIPRAHSLQTVALNGIRDKNIAEYFDRSATIRPAYGFRRNHTNPKKFLESFHPKTIPSKQDSGYGSGIFSVEESNENLVKPSVVREIARRFSYLPEQPWNKKNDTTGFCKQDLNNRKRETSSYQRQSLAEEFYRVGSKSRQNDLANGSTCTLPISRKLKDEYLSVLANKRVVGTEYENTRITLCHSQRDHL